MPKIGKITTRFFKVLRFLFLAMGIVMTIVVTLAFTSLPFWAHYQLGIKNSYLPEKVNSIVMMGAEGFPSGNTLTRLWYIDEMAKQYPNAKVVIATPGDTLDANSTICQSKAFVIHLGIDSNRIVLENVGLNTRHQALKTYTLLKNGKIQEPILIVTSPSHVYRSVCAFEKAGFAEVYGKPATSLVLETDLTIEGDELGGTKAVPNVGGSTFIRYRFWDYLGYELSVAREYMAIAYYKLKGWM